MNRRLVFTLVAAALLGGPSLDAAPFAFTSPTQGDQPGAPQQPGQEQPGVPGRKLAAPDDSANAKHGFLKGDSLTGDWGGLRDTWKEKGFTISPVYQAEVFGNTGGAKQGTISDGLFNVALDLDLERITGFWKDATIHANALYIYGSNLSARYVGDFSTTSNIAGYNSLRLQEAWLEQNFSEQRFSIRAGLLVADTQFFTSDTAGLFIDSTFGTFPLIGANFTNVPIYPVASPGVRFSIAPTPKVYLRAAVFSADSGADPTGNNAHGTHFHLNAADGALLAGEVGYLINQGPDDHGLVGSYKLGALVQRGQYPTFDSLARAALGTGRLSGKGTNYAVYAVADQQVFHEENRTISAFVRGGFAPAPLSFVDCYCDAGFNCTGCVPRRPDDIAGIAFGYSHVSGDFSDASRRQGESGSSYEAIFEATYKVVLAPWWSVQPDFQYVFNPSGVVHSRDAVVIGLRTTVAF